MSDIKVLIADDHALLRAGIRELLQNMNGIEVVGEAANGREALEKINECSPDIVLLDIAMSELNGLEVAERVHRDFPLVSVIILSMYANEEYVLQALKVGAYGYLLKDSAPNELEIAIKAVVKGDTYLSPLVSKTLVTDYLKRINEKPLEDKNESNVFIKLTSRQREILQLIAEGNSTKTIAIKLHLSAKTVETHRMKIMERLAIHDIPGLVRYAIRTGIISSQ
ncbi:MAG TPA: response regulator transcription factor [Ignavibacteriaceae bacterium]|nr:response regulator transcription factor [Ignavibacteriaceae bacterium]